MISVVIPVLNEAKTLARRDPIPGCETIFVDGGSSDGSAEIAAQLGRVVRSQRGRGMQMNAGARAASGQILIFLHADAHIEPSAVNAVRNAVRNGRAGGGFTPRIDAPGALYRCIERAAAFRARRLKLFYGDAGVFATRNAFQQIGGFPDIPICEEFGFSKKLRRYGPVVLLPDICRVSPRRWQKLGILRATLLNWTVAALYFLGVPPKRLAKIYRAVR